MSFGKPWLDGVGYPDIPVGDHFGRIQLSEFYHHPVYAAQHRINIGFLNSPLGNGAMYALLVSVQELVDPGFDTSRCGKVQIGIILMAAYQLPVCPSVGADNTVLAPFVYGYIFQHRMHGAGDPVIPVIGRHIGPRSANRHPFIKRIGIILPVKALAEIR